MAGYFIYSLAWEPFQKFVQAPSEDQVMKFANEISERLKGFDEEIEGASPLNNWPLDPKELQSIARQRLSLSDWYGDLPDIGKKVIHDAIFGLCIEVMKKEFQFQAESDGVYWNVIELACKHHGCDVDIPADNAISDFGNRPFRFKPIIGHRPGWDDWQPMHSMQSPDEVQRLLEELKQAEPTVKTARDQETIDDYENELMPAIEKVAQAGRLLFIQTDT